MPCLTSWRDALPRRNITSDGKFELNIECMLIERCIQCEQLFFPMMRICREDHMYCAVCEPEECLICHTVVDPVHLRSHKTVDSKLYARCWYEDLGCKMVGEPMQVLIHEGVCPFGRKACTFLVCPSPRESISKRSICAHFETNHGMLVETLVPETLPVEIYFLYRQTCDLFLFVIEEDGNGRCYNFILFFIGDKPEYRDKFQYEIDVYPLRSGLDKKTKKGYCKLYNADEAFDDLDRVPGRRNEGMLSISFREARYFFNKIDKMFSVKIEIQPVDN